MFRIVFATVLALQMFVSAKASAAIDPPAAPEQVLAVPEGLREDFRKQVLETTRAPNLRLKRLVEFMFDQKGLGVEYEPSATYTVAEVYRTRKANCLAFTLLTVALAREAGLEAYGQQIDRVLSWDVTGRVVLQSLHANAGVVIDNRHFVVDVASDEIRASSVQHRISDDRLLALYYDNRAMELMVAGHYADAKTWLDTALRYSPDDAAFWNNAGVLNQRMGNAAEAEHLLLKAVGRNPRLTSALSNLVAMYRNKGDAENASLWQARADKVMHGDPFYQFAVGQQKEQAGEFDEAISHYRRAIGLNRGEELFHFGLARAYFRLGKLRMANLELSRAYDLSSGQDRERYRGKLDALRQARR